MAQSPLDRELARLKRNTAAKLRRLKTREGFSANVLRALDPRSTGATGTLTPAQKRSLISQLKQFNSRNTTFYADSDKQPISHFAFQDYKRAEKKFNASIVADVSRYAKIALPDDPEMTLDQYVRYRPNYVKLRRNPSGTGMYSLYHLPRNLSALNLENYTNWLHRKASKEYREEKIESFWKSVKGMSKSDPYLYDLTSQLTDKQISILMNYTRFASYLAEFYRFDQSSEGGHRWAQGLEEKARGMVEQHVEWAQRHIV